jgi:hypothetical protein
MHRIKIFSGDDLKQLKNLSGDDTVILKIYKSFQPSVIPAIDMANFGGKIVVDFMGNNFHDCTVVNPYNSPCFFLFTNIDADRIKLSSVCPLSITYRKIEQDLYFNSEQSFSQIDPTFLHPKQITIHLTRDLALENFPPSFLDTFHGTIILDGHHHAIYAKNTEYLKSFMKRCQVRNLNVVAVDHVILIQKASDFDVLRHLKKGVVVVKVCNDISDEQMDSLVLNDFCGKMIILGNNYRLRNVKIQSSCERSGFISSIQPASDLIIDRLSFENVSFSHQGECHDVGVILGGRGFVSEKARSHFMPGRIEISNCTVHSCVLPNAQSIGPIVGLYDDAMFINECQTISITSANNQPVLQNSSLHLNYYLYSFYPAKNVCHADENESFKCQVTYRKLKK